MPRLATLGLFLVALATPALAQFGDPLPPNLTFPPSSPKVQISGTIQAEGGYLVLQNGSTSYRLAGEQAKNLGGLMGQRATLEGRTRNGTLRIEAVVSPQWVGTRTAEVDAQGRVRIRSLDPAARLAVQGPLAAAFGGKLSGRVVKIRGFVVHDSAGRPVAVSVSAVQATVKQRAAVVRQDQQVATVDRADQVWLTRVGTNHGFLRTGSASGWVPLSCLQFVPTIGIVNELK